MKTMTREDIRTELGWTENMIHSLLENPDSINVRRCKNTGGYTCGQYKRERVLAVAQSTEGRAAKRRWDETLRGTTPNTGWNNTTRRFRTGTGHHSGRCRKISDRLGYRFDRHVTDVAVAAGCGVRRWGGYAMHDNWHMDRTVSAIRSAALVPGKPAVADVLGAAIANRNRGSGSQPASVNGRKCKPHVGTKRRP
jgi:hypothetical protein